MPIQTATEEARHPFEVFLLTFTLIIGVRALLIGGGDGAVSDMMSDYVEIVWSGFLVIGSLLALYGISTRRRVIGLLFEQVGVAALGGSALLYSAVILFSVRNSVGLFTAVICAWFALSCGRRWRQIQKRIDQAQRLAGVANEGENADGGI